MSSNIYIYYNNSIIFSSDWKFINQLLIKLIISLIIILNVHK